MTRAFLPQREKCAVTCYWCSTKTHLLPRYSGTVSSEPYLGQVMLAALHNGWGTEETATYVTLALEGKALKVLLDLTLAEQRDYPTLAAALQRQFGQ